MQGVSILKVLHLSHSDINGGAARAAYRIHDCLRDAGVDSRMWANKPSAGDWTVEGPVSKLEKAMASLRPHLASPIVKALKTDNPIIHSPSVFPSQWVRRANASDADIVHLHWVQGEMLAVADIGRIEKPIVWTLHDMWAFCGAEHYTDDQRWRDGYRRDNRPTHESGFDLNRWTWQRKRKHWQHPMHIVTPSHWLADCVRKSALMCDWPVSVVANSIDTERWQPLKQVLARELLGLPPDVPLLLFGAMGGGADPRKGFDLLLRALEHLRHKPHAQGLELIIFGQRAPQSSPNLGFPIHYTGHLHDDLSLRALYSAADALTIPSWQDNLPNTGLEAQACGTPVVAFDVAGLPDIVEHRRTGFLAPTVNCESLAEGIAWAIDNRKNAGLRDRCRTAAVDRYSYSTIAAAYEKVYEQVLRDG